MLASSGGGDFANPNGAKECVADVLRSFLHAVYHECDHSGTGLRPRVLICGIGNLLCVNPG